MRPRLCRFRLAGPASLLLAGLACAAAADDGAKATPVVPLRHAHAHNDYEHSRPLFDALDNGFCSVEADISLVDGKLLVAHKPSETSPKKTSQRLYLDPLRERIKANGGRVYTNGPEFTLLIDLKQSWKVIYP